MPLLVPLSMASDWSLPHGGGSSSTGTSEQEDSSLSAAFGRIQTSTLDRPPLRSHKSFPYTLATSSYASPHTQSPSSQVAAPSMSEAAALSMDSDFNREELPEMTVQMTYGGSAPVSPVPQLTPTSVEDEGREMAEAIEDAMLGEDEEQTKDEQPREKTAAERRAEKRKMKRFRLTHNQTRFLMSEFARQAHPDAAQRERLSREIPGLSPRQVQVWFQNRRAKLKRLTTDDRERIMKSRALPEDFDMTQALHSPFIAGGGQSLTQAQTTPLASPAIFPSYDGSLQQPLNVAGLRRESEDEATISPISISSNFGQFFTPPASVANSETLSPVSPTNDRAPFMPPSYAQPIPRGTNIWSNQSSSFSNYHAPHVPRLQLHDRINRTRADSLSSPLRTSMSYTGNLDHATTTTEGAVSHSPGPRSRPYWSEALSPTQGSTDYTSGFQASALARSGPISTTFPPGLNLQPQGRSLLPFSSLSQPQGLRAGRPGTQQPAFQTIMHSPTVGSPPTSQATPQSLLYGGAPLQIPDVSGAGSQTDLYSMPFPDPEDDPLNPFGAVGAGNVGSEPISTGGIEAISSGVLEPESYYRSEPYAYRIASNLGLGGRPHSSSFGEGMAPQSPTAALSRPQQQALASPYLAGSKRRRDSSEVGSEPERAGADEFEGGSRKRSYTMPSGFRGSGI